MQLFRSRYIYLSLVSLLFGAQAFCSGAPDGQDGQQNVHASFGQSKMLSQKEIDSIMRKLKESPSALEGEIGHLQTTTPNADSSKVFPRIPAIRSTAIPVQNNNT